MPEAATLDRPTNRDEAWRYADASFLAEAELAALNNWQELDIPSGQKREDTRVMTAGVERLRVRIGKGARYAIFALNAAGPYARLEVDVTLDEGAHFIHLWFGRESRRQWAAAIRHRSLLPARSMLNHTGPRTRR